MTLIAGYIYKGKSHIIADSAETMEIQGTGEVPPPASFTSSFQDSPFLDLANKTLVAETANKIYVLKNQILVTFSGTVKEGLDIIGQLKYLLERPTQQSLTDAIQEFLIHEDPQDTQYIIGGMQDNIPFLIVYYNRENNYVIIDTDFYVVGAGMRGDFQKVVFDTVINCHENNISSEESLIYIIAKLQTLSLHCQSFKEGVGGFFNGVSISNEGIGWAKDTAYYLYSSYNYLEGDEFYISKYNRDNCVFIAAPQFRRIFWNEESEELVNTIVEKWKEELDKKARNYKADYYVMMSYDSCSAVIVSNKIGKLDRIKTYGGKTPKLKIPKNIVIQMFECCKPEDFPGGVQQYRFYTNFLP